MGINLGQTPMTAVYLGQTAVKSVFFGDKQVWGLSPVVSNYDIQSIGRSTSQQGTSIEITEQAGDTITLYIKTNATDLTGKQVCVAVYTGATEVTPYASFAFSNVSLVGRYITGTTPDVSTWVPSGFPETYSTLYMKTWIQDTGDIDPADALGEVLDWTGTEFISKGLKFVAEENNSTIGLKKVGTAPTVYLLTSDNGVDWNQYTVGDSISLPNVGDYVYFKAAQTNNSFANSDYSYNNFFGTGKVGAYGNVEYLRDENASLTSLSQWAYKSLFADCSALTHAPELTISASIPYCAYNYMFGSCTSLSTGPSVIPSKVISQYGCVGMFEDCSALTAAPEISATSIGEGAFSRMFNRCTSLVKAPSHLYATTIAGRAGYDAMFRDCQSLTASPIIDLTNVSTAGCCTYMFYGCTNLQKVEVPNLTQWTSGTTNYWLSGVAETGEFICPAELPDIRGDSNIPVDWTKVDTVQPLCFTAQEANSTVRLDKVGSPNFISIKTSTNGSTWTDYSWTNNTGDTLTLANVGDKVYMRAKTSNQTIGNGDSNYYQFKMTGRIAASGNIQTLLKSSGDVYAAPRYCYRNIFKGCTSLTTAPDLPATTLGDHCYMDAFNGCTALTATPKLPATTLGTYCYQGTFSGCTSLKKVEALPATTLADYCYCWMFGNCKSLREAPKLQATHLAYGCFENMFNGCSSLSSIEVAFSTWGSGNTNWVKNVAASGTFTCPAALPDTRGTNNIPTGWTKVDAA